MGMHHGFSIQHLYLVGDSEHLSPVDEPKDSDIGWTQP